MTDAFADLEPAIAAYRNRLQEEKDKKERMDNATCARAKKLLEEMGLHPQAFYGDGYARFKKIILQIRVEYESPVVYRVDYCRLGCGVEIRTLSKYLSLDAIGELIAYPLPPNREFWTDHYCTKDHQNIQTGPVPE